MGASAGQPFNVNTAASQGLQGAMAGTAAGMGYTPQQVSAPLVGSTGYKGTSYNPALAGSQGYRAAQAGATGYNAAQAGSTGYDAAQAGSTGYNAATMGAAPTVQAGQLAGTDLGAYTNPYESSVIQGLQKDALTNYQQGVNQLGAEATRAGAFGGSRHGVAQGTLAANTTNALNNQIAGLRQAGYQNAQQMAQQDIATRMQAGLANQGAGMQAALANMNALNQAGQFGASAANQAALQNAAAVNQARGLGASAANTAALQNAAAANQAGQFGASAMNQASLANQAAQNTASQFGAGAANQAAMQNQAALNAAGQFGASAANTANQFGASAANNAAIQNQNAIMQAQLANQSAGLSGASQRLGAANQLGSLANLGFGMGQQINNQMMQQGAMQQALQQMAMDKAAGQYAGYQQSPYQALTAYTSAIGGTPYPQASTQTQNTQRGLFDYLGMGLYGAGVMAPAGGYSLFA